MLIFATFLGGLGQLLFKIGLDALPGIYYFVIFLALGGIVYALSTILYLYILGKAHLSWVYGFVGLSYLFAAIFAVLVLHESITVFRWAGILVIVAGVALIGLS